MNASCTVSSRVDAYLGLQERSTPTLIPNPHDVGTARLLEAAGFEAFWTTSAGHAFTLGRPDNSVSRSEALEHAAAIARASSVPVVADLERGFGDRPEDVCRTVELALATELVGCSIEDATQRPDEPLYPLALGAERIRAAKACATSSGRRFLISARAENFLVGVPDLADTIQRLQAYQDAGADTLFAPGVKRVADLQAIMASVDRPVDVLFGPQCEFDLATLARLGVRRAILGSLLTSVAFGAVERAAAELLASGTFGFAKDALGFDRLSALFGDSRFVR